MASPCIEDIVKAAEGKISQRDAGRILRELSHRAKTMAAKEKIPLEDAAKKVTEEVAIEEELKAYVAKRAKLFAIRSKIRMLTAARSGRGKDLADSLLEYMNEVANAGHAKGTAFADKFFATLEAEKVFNDFKTGGPQLSKDVFIERWQLTSGLPFATQNKTAQVVAKAIREIEVEYLASARKHGAWSQDAPGYTGPQTHNPELLRKAGYPSGKMHGKENQVLSYDVWRKTFSDKGGNVVVDWDRTLPGSDKVEQEAMLKSFHQSIYSGTHGTTSDIVDPSKHLGMGSLAERISSERLLWFADPESQWNYNQRWGNSDFNQSIVNELFSFGRNISMLQYLGPSPEATYQNVVKILRNDSKSLLNAQDIGKKLGRKEMQGAYDIVSGRANTSVNTFLSKMVDSIKAMIISSKGGGILFSMIGDRVFIDSSLARQGASALHRMNVQIGKIAANTEQGKRELRSLGFLVHAMASQMHERWATDVRPYFNLDKAVNWAFKLQGVDYVGNKHRMIAMSAASEHLGAMSSKAFDDLPVEMRVHLEGYQFNRAEWDAVRSTAFDIKGDEIDWRVIAPDRMQDIPDNVIDGLLEAEGITLSQPNRSRKRDLLESKMQAYFSDVASEMVPTPGLRERLKMTGGGLQKGTIIRSVLDLFFTFKGFGVTVAMRNARAYGRLWAAGQYKAVGWQVATMVAEAAALGYVGWAVREAFKGRTPPLITDENGELDAKQFASVFLESLKRGGGLGIYGDYLLSSYNRDNKTFLESVAGPVLSELDPLAALGTSTFKTVLGEQEPASFALQSLRFAEANAPFINLFYSKMALDYLFLWHLKEGLQPGIFRKTEQAIGDQWRQEYFIDPIE